MDIEKARRRSVEIAAEEAAANSERHQNLDKEMREMEDLFGYEIEELFLVPGQSHSKRIMYGIDLMDSSGNIVLKNTSANAKRTRWLNLQTNTFGDYIKLNTHDLMRVRIGSGYRYFRRKS